MRRPRKVCLVTLLLVSSSFQFDRFIAARSQQTLQESHPVATALSTVPQAQQAAQAAALKGVKYPMIFPDKTVTKLFRDGTLICQPNNGGCSFVFPPLEKSTSVD
ncbi:MAG: hypothetical protein ACREA2_23455 [Blastocatellia bacterium]